MIDRDQLARYVRVVRQRPSVDELWDCREWTAEPIRLQIDPEYGEYGEEDWHLGPQLSRRGDITTYVLIWSDPHTGTYPSVIQIRDGERRPGDQGTCELGAIVDQTQWYEHGTDLVTLAASGFRLGWTAAQWLHAVARLDLIDLHHAAGKIHGALRAKRIRLGLLDTTPDHRKFSALSQELDVFPPVLFLDGSMQAGDDARRAEELAVLAGGIAELTRHPDPRVDALIRDPAGWEVLRDLLLEGDVAIDPLLGDLVGLEAGPPPDDTTIDRDLRALWTRVMELDPMLEPPLEWTGPIWWRGDQWTHAPHEFPIPEEPP
jgi:hypothetical protein